MCDNVRETRQGQIASMNSMFHSDSCWRTLQTDKYENKKNEEEKKYLQSDIENEAVRENRQRKNIVMVWGAPVWANSANRRMKEIMIDSKVRTTKYWKTKCEKKRLKCRHTIEWEPHSNSLETGRKKIHHQLSIVLNHLRALCCVWNDVDNDDGRMMYTHTQ